MEAVIHQPLGDVLDRDARIALDRAAIDDAFVRDAAAGAPIDDREMRLQAVGHVVGVEDRDPRRLEQARRPHERDVGPGDGQDQGAPPGSRGDGADARAGTRLRDQGMVGQERRQMRLDADRADAGAAAAVGDAEGLVQVEVHHVGAELGGPADPHHSVEVGAVHVDLTAVRVDDAADVGDALLEHAVGRGIGDHQRRQPVGVPPGLGFEVAYVDVALGIAVDDHDLAPGHHRARRVGAVSGTRDETDVAALVPPVAMPRPDGQQAGVLALRSGVGLQGDGVETADFRQRVLEAPDHLDIAGGLVEGRERMDVGELGPGDRQHLGRRVELHGAGAERDHGPVEGDVLRLQTGEIAEHRGLRTVAVERLVGEKRRSPRVAWRNPGAGAAGERVQVGRRRAVAGEGGQHGADVAARRRLVHRDAHGVAVDRPQVDAARARPRHDRPGAARRRDGKRVEERLVADGEAELAQARRQNRRVSVDAPGDGAEPVRPVPYRVQAGDHRQQDLRRADVARRPLAPDVLLARLQREAMRRASAGVDRLADDPAGNGAAVVVARRQEGRVRAAEAERRPEALRAADHDVGAEFPRRLEQDERQQVGRHHDQPAPGVNVVDDSGVVGDGARHVRVLQQDAEDVRRRQVRGLVADDDVDPQRRRAGPQDVDGLRQAALGDEEAVSGRPGDATAHGHRLGGGRAFVEQRGVGERHPRQVRDHGLVVEEGLQAALGDLRLVRGVGRVPPRILQNVAQYHRRRYGAVIPEADHRFQDPVALRHAAEFGQDVRFRPRTRKAQGRRRADGPRHGGVDQGLQRFEPERRQHRRRLAVVRPDVAADEVAGLFAFGGGERVLDHLPSPSQANARHGPDRSGSFTNAAYWSASISPSSSPGSLILILTNQPLPSASRLTCAGSSPRASLTSTISPLTGA